MLAEVINIGDELLIGQVTNTNATWLCKHLSLIGIKVTRVTTVGDTYEEILNILYESGKRSDIIIITGGLGPTSDDITKPVLCKFFETSLKFNNAVYEQVQTFLAQRGGSMNELNRNQAMVPANAKTIQNYQGTAPGLWFEKNNKIYISLPGVPFEMEALMNNYVLPELKEKFHLPVLYHKTVLTSGIPESKLALTINEWEKKLPENIKLAYLPSPGIVKLRLTGIGESNIRGRIEEEILKLQSIIGNAIYGYDNDTLEIIIGRILTDNHQTLSTAESCTGGNIARLITSVPGSSGYFLGSIVAYSNNVKTNQLEVPEMFIQQHGAVSKQVVEAMANGALKRFFSHYSIAVSGIAGPTGGSPEKPAGTTWIAVASSNNIISEKYLFGNNRERNITLASVKALDMLRKLLMTQ